MSNFVRKELRYRQNAQVTPAAAGQAHIQGETVAVGQAYHLDSEAQFKRDLEQSLAEIVKKRLQEAEDEAIALVKVAEETAEKNARQISEEILSKANAQAREMVELAQSQVETIQESAREAGFKNGFQEGYADATAQVEQEVTGLLQSAQLLAENAYQAEKLVLKNFEKNALTLIRHLSRKILQRELAENPDMILRQLQQAVESLYLTGKIKVVVNPQALQELRAFSAVTESALSEMSRYEFMVDPLLDVHQLFIVGEEGSFDLSLDTRIAQLIDPLQEALTLPRPEPLGADLRAPEAAEALAEATQDLPAEIEPVKFESPAYESKEAESLIPLDEVMPEDTETTPTQDASATSPLEEAPEVDSPHAGPVAPAITPFEFPAFDSKPPEGDAEDEAGPAL
ncbi:FliH/SctL family protein [Vampirovibrio chlorellavorus]|uniref:FliH/SctL family protein n=1 Tax=Vampirovibrio chlorellavorus TaxID=758823 RepID=UPI0026F0CF61|nr:FliH/SctL family protein [Vampirovibrio chlorellavorus]